MGIILAIASLCTFAIVVFMLSKLSNYLNEKKKLEYLIPSNLRVPTDEELEIFNQQYYEVGKSCRTNKFKEYKKSLTNKNLKFKDKIRMGIFYISPNLYKSIIKINKGRL